MSLSRIARYEAHVEEVAHGYRDREDVPGIKAILLAVRYVLSDTKRVLVELAREYAEDQTDKLQATFEGRIGALLSSLETELHPLIDVASHVHGRDLEVLVAPVSRLARGIDPNSELIFEPGDAFRIQHKRLRGVIKLAQVNGSADLEAALKGLPTVAVVTYPAPLDADVLLHAVLAHEIAHLALSSPPGNRIMRDVLDRYNDRLFAECAHDAGTTTANLQLVELKRRLQNWFQEFACDRLAVAMVGPSYPFALFDVEGPRSRWLQRDPKSPGYDTHPGLAWRMRLTLQYLHDWLPAEHIDTNDSEHAAWKALRHAINELTSMLPEEENALSQVENDVLDDALSQLTDTVITQMILTADYEPGLFRRELPVVWDKLAAGIPPAEWIFARQEGGDGWSPDAPEGWSKPIEWQSILAGAYVYWLAGRCSEAPSFESPPTPWRRDAVPEWQRINEMVRGSIELSELLRALKGARDSLHELNPGHA